MEEVQVAIVPRVFRISLWEFAEYGVILTDKRTIFVNLKDPDRLAGYSLGGLLGGRLLSVQLGQIRNIDFSNVDPDALASLEDSIVIPHAILQDLRFKPTSEHYEMFLKCKTPKGRSKKYYFGVAPPLHIFRQMRRERQKKKSILDQYAAYVQEMYQKALPPSISRIVKWSIRR